MIDTDTETTAGLEFAGNFLLMLAAGRHKEDLSGYERDARKADPEDTCGYERNPTKPRDLRDVLNAEIGDPAPTAAHTATAPASAPSASAASAFTPPVPPPTGTARTVDAFSPPFAEEYDDSGMPWDARIHQRGKAQKKDGTWKLQKNIDQSLVKSVVQELAGRRRSAPPAVPPPPPAEAAPVRLPILPEQPKGHVTPETRLPPNVSLAPPLPPGTLPPGAIPPPPPGPFVPAGDDPFRKLVDKIIASKIPPIRVMEIVRARGAPNLQSVNTMQDLIPLIDGDVDAEVLGVSRS